jgi:hypothetical protein
VKRALPLLVAAAGFVALGLLWIVTDRRAAQRVYDEYSSANTSEQGLSLASGYLAKRGKVAMLTRPLSRAAVERNAVVFRVVDSLPTFFDPEDLEKGQFGPPRPKVQPLLSDDELAFVRGGGRFVIAANGGGLPIAFLGGAGEARKVFPIWPAVGDFKLPADAYGFQSLPPRMHALFASGEIAVIARERLGAGELYVLSTPELLRNDNLVRHLALLAALAGSGRPVYFDEVPHGMRTGDGSLALMKEWNLGPLLLLLLAVAALYFWRHGRRIGPPEEDFRDTRSDAVDLVRSLGALYRDVTTPAEGIALYHDALVRTVASQTGLRGDALHKRVADLTGGLQPDRKRHLPTNEFRRQLEQINEGFMKLRGPR